MPKDKHKTLFAKQIWINRADITLFHSSSLPVFPSCSFLFTALLQTLTLFVLFTAPLDTLTSMFSVLFPVDKPYRLARPRYPRRYLNIVVPPYDCLYLLLKHVDVLHKYSEYYYDVTLVI